MNFFRALLILLFVLQSATSLACSMYKITVNKSTVVGCNEDAWRTTPSIWFVKASETIQYGAAFTGSRLVGPNTFTPQSGMNEAGLVFSRLSAYHPKQVANSTAKKPITNEASYLSAILHSCRNVFEAKELIEQYDHSVFIDDVFIYVDSLGRYLIVEPYSLTIDSLNNYVLSNFCPSITSTDQARKLDRFKNGEDFIVKHAPSYSPTYFKNLADTMHVCRNRNGDGTLLTSIWDSNKKTVLLYFYHDYDSTVTFNLNQQLLKQDTLIQISALFPANKEFERLAEYITPFNTPSLRIGLVATALLLLLLVLFFIVFAFKKLIPKNLSLLMVLLNGLLIGYFFVLATNMYIYYFDAPYVHYSNKFISISSYIPFAVVALVAGIILQFETTKKSFNYSSLSKSLLTFNMAISILAVGLFAYWGLFSIL